MSNVKDAGIGCCAVPPRSDAEPRVMSVPLIVPTRPVIEFWFPALKNKTLFAFESYPTSVWYVVSLNTLTSVPKLGVVPLIVIVEA